MTQAEAVESVFQRWKANWVSTPYWFEGEQFTPPTTGQWARLSVRHGESNQVTLGQPGSRKFDRQLSVRIQIFDQVNNGRATLDALSGAARALYEGVSFDDLAFPGRARVIELGADAHGREQFLVEAQGFYEEVR